MLDADHPITIYNDNQACIDWSASVTTKGTKHLNLRENYVRESQHMGITKITHIPGVINASDIFTKELKDTAHFRRCRDTMMVSKTIFDHYGHVLPSHLHGKTDLPFSNLRSPFPLNKTPLNKHDSNTALLGQKVSQPFLPAASLTGG